MLQKYVDQLTLVGRTALKKLNTTPRQPTLISIARAARRQRDEGRTKQTYLSDSEVLSNAELVVTAGTDTSATALPATIYFLTINSSAMKKVIEEIRRFASEDEINSQSINQVPYLTACLYEALRLYAPVPEGLPRICPDPGQDICGYWIPGGTFCQVSPHAANISSANFKDAQRFLPERWLHSDLESSAPFAGDQKMAFRPFSTGPRDCIGQNFALTSIRLTLCRLLYRFDIKIATDENWVDQRCYLLWRRRPLLVYLTPVQQTNAENVAASS